MAAQANEPFNLEILDLRHFQSGDLREVLEEERRVWATELHWDFQPSCEIVRRYLDLRALSGYALLDGHRTVGYSYYVHEDHKVLIGDLFVSQPYRSLEAQHLLLRHVVETAENTPGVRRIEGQLMMLDSGAVAALYSPTEISVFERNFMLVDGIARLGRERFGRAPSPQAIFERWSERHVEATAELIARAYQGHVDSRINDQYRSVAGARRFLHNIIQYPGCGSFHEPAAEMALDRRTGELCGVSLTSMVESRVGHITQICVAPEWRGLGIGSELLWRSMRAFCDRGCETVSLTVTASNTGAVQLYERIGFRTIRRFRAYVWEHFVRN
jgi:ribosomal protein S18 acetylase RimI-like enzyme